MWFCQRFVGCISILAVWMFMVVLGLSIDVNQCIYIQNHTNKIYSIGYIIKVMSKEIIIYKMYQWEV